MITLGGTAAVAEILPGGSPLYANVTGMVPTDKETYQDGTLAITDARGGVVYAHTPRFKGRGNTTWGAPKKPFKVRSLDRLQRPFGFAASRDWAFMADWFDESYLRTAVGFELYRRATGRWAPHSRHVWLDWEGATTAGGLYRYSETVDVQVGRVDIRKMDEGDIASNALTGPYFVETDDYYDSPGFQSALGTPVMWDTPEEPTAEQIAYMKAWTDATEAILLTGTAEQIAARIDLDSFVDWYLLMEFVRNHEARWFKSIKWMKDQDAPNGTGKAVMLSPWDMDLTLGQAWNEPSEPTGWDVRVGAYSGDSGSGRPNWFGLLWERWPAFQVACAERWESAFAPAIDDLWPWLDAVAEQIAPRIVGDRAMWYSGTTQPTMHTAAAIKAWMQTRAAWITANL